jgi:opacity protein-like surface antigen
MMKKMIPLGVLFTLTLFLAMATSVAAQKGFVASASFASTGVNFDDDDIRNESGFGLQLDLGYNFNSRLGLFLGLGGFALEDENETLGYFDIGPRFYPISSRGLQPYIDVALTGSAFASDDGGVETTISGVGLSGGGGVHWFVGRNVALNLGIMLSRVNYDKVESEGVSVDGLDFKAWNSRIKAGVAFYF